MRQEIAEGLRYAMRTPVIRLVLGLLFCVSITVFNFTVYVPLLARHVLGLGAEGFGFLMAGAGRGRGERRAHGRLPPGGPAPFGVMMGAAALALTGLLSLAFGRAT